MGYQYLQETVNPFKVPYFNLATFWKPVYSNVDYTISVNHTRFPMFKVDINQDYYFVFGAIRNVNNIMNLHICRGNTIIASMKVETNSQVMSETRKLLAVNNYNLTQFCSAISAHPLLKLKPTFTQMMAITTKFHYAITFTFNSSFSTHSYKSLSLVVNFLTEVTETESSHVSQKYYTAYFIDDDIAFEKYVDKESDFGIRLARFVKFTQHSNIVVLASVNKNNVYFIYTLYKTDGIIKADINAKMVSHVRRNKDKKAVSVTLCNDMDEAFFGVFNRYFATSLVNYPSEHFISFAEQYGLNIQEVSPDDCLTLVDMATV